MIHQNSLFALQEEKDAGKLDKRSKMILGVLESSPLRTWNGGMHARQIMKALGFTDANSVKPRITEMIAAGILEECGSTKDRETGKTVRLVRIKKSLTYPD